MRREKRGFKRREQFRSGAFRHLVAWAEHGTQPPPNATRLLDDGDIRNVFEQSASLWDDLAVLATEGGLTNANATDATEPSEDEPTRTEEGVVEGGMKGTRSDKAAARCSFVMPILARRHWTRCRYRMAQRCWALAVSSRRRRNRCGRASFRRSSTAAGRVGPLQTAPSFGAGTATARQPAAPQPHRGRRYRARPGAVGGIEVRQRRVRERA